MTTLFVANTSSRHHEFLFRIPGNEQVRRVTINAGKQMEVIRGAQEEEVNAIIEQHKPYGLIHVSQVKKVSDFVGLMYQLDRPVDSGAMEIAVEKNNDVLIEKGHELRKEAAVAANATLSDTITNSGDKVGKQNAMSIEVVEQPTEENQKKQTMKEKIRVADHD